MYLNKIVNFLKAKCILLSFQFPIIAQKTQHYYWIKKKIQIVIGV